MAAGASRFFRRAVWVAIGADASLIARWYETELAGPHRQPPADKCRLR